MLTELGYHETAYKIATQTTYPSWGYMLANGATTLWERWEYATGDAMNSHNHPMMGSVGSWFYKYVAGIQPDVKYPGFEKFIIHPYFFKELDHAEGELNTVKGVIKSAWRRQGKSLVLEVTIPANSTAEVHLPAKSVNSVTENGVKIADAKGIKLLNQSKNGLTLEAGSGIYHFNIKN
jgi:alpha-L-rhamnosidase